MTVLTCRANRKYVQRELTLAEMLDDDIVQALMRADRVQRRDVEFLWRHSGRTRLSAA